MGLVAGGNGAAADSALTPAAMLLFELMFINIVLAVFNLIPVPPLDGSHVLRNVTGMGYEAYANFARFGFIIVIVLLQIPAVRSLLAVATYGTRDMLGRFFGVY